MAARRRETNRWDAVINGVNYRLKRQEGAYRKVSGRSQLEVQQMLNQAGNQFTSRRDLRTLFQTDWSGGAQWQKPLLSDQSIDTYNVSNGFDLVSEPGNVIPVADPNPAVDYSSGSNTLGYYGNLVQVSATEIYLPEGVSGARGLIKYDGAGGYSTLTNDFGGTTDHVRLCWDAANSTVFGIFADGHVRYVTPDSAGGDVIDVGTVYRGANIFTQFGRLLVWTGEKLIEVSDPLGTPSITTIYDDGMGPDMANEVSMASANRFIQYYDMRLAISSAEGVWIVKNVEQEGGPTPFIYRVDRTNDGTNVGVPVATLPPGTLVLDIAFHLGSLMMAATSDTLGAFQNNATSYGYPQIDYYHLTNDSLGSVGTVDGTASRSDAVFHFAGTYQGVLYLSGEKSLWQYDPVRGGIHQLFATSGGNHISAQLGIANTNGASVGVTPILLCYSGGDLNAITLDDEGGNTWGHTLESNYIDGNLPAELKSLVGVTLMTDGIKTNETWTIAIEADDGSFANVATFNTVGNKTEFKSLASAVTGYRFRYKITYTASSDVSTPSRVKGIVLHMVQGEMVTAWQLTIDGTEMRSVENTVLRPEDALADLETLMAKQTMTTFVDEMRVTSSTHDVRVDSVQVSRSSPSEIEEAVVVLTEQDLDN